MAPVVTKVVTRVPPKSDRPEPVPSWRWRRVAATMAYVGETYRLAPPPLKLIAWAVAIAVAHWLGVPWPCLPGLVE